MNDRIELLSIIVPVYNEVRTMRFYSGRRTLVWGALDWPSMAEVASQVPIYRPDDRERYLRGTRPPTEYAR